MDGRFEVRSESAGLLDSAVIGRNGCYFLPSAEKMTVVPGTLIPPSIDKTLLPNVFWGDIF